MFGCILSLMSNIVRFIGVGGVFSYTCVQKYLLLKCSSIFVGPKIIKVIC